MLLAASAAFGSFAPPAVAQVTGIRPPLRTFTLDKPASERTPFENRDAQPLPDPELPDGRDVLRSTIGLGYVQGADWGLDLQSTGAVAGFALRTDALVTQGIRGTTVERGSIMVGDPDAGWRLEAGDIFSPLYGASRGARFAWGSRRVEHTVGVFTSRYRSAERPVVGAYRGRIRLAERVTFDTEIATSGAVMVGSGFTVRRLSLEASWRHIGGAAPTSDRAIWASWALGPMTVGGGLVRSEADGDRSHWNVVSVRFPLARWLDIGLERTFSSYSDVATATTAFMADVDAGRLRYFQRAEWGESTMLPAAGPLSIARQQVQSMASYTAGPRLRVSLQLATAWDDRGRRDQWEEVETVFMPTRTTQVLVAAPVPDVGNPDRFRARIVQQLPGRFGLFADYGRLAPYQSGRVGLDSPRVRVMVTRTFDLGSQARGGEVRGRVLDHAGQPVAGARVKLGRYATNTDATGHYAFRALPAASYELSLDERYLPANFAWDGRRVSLAVTRTTHHTIDILVAPLNAIHGRVYADENGNRRFDEGEGVTGVVVRLGERVTATDEQGAYSFYNVWPGRYVVAIDDERMPEGWQPSGDLVRDVELHDDHPARGIDFLVSPRVRKVLWKGGSR